MWGITMRPLSLSDQVSFLLKAWFNMKSFAFVGAGSEQCADICESEFFCIHSVFCSLVHFRYKTFADNIESYLDPARMLFDLNTHLIHYDATRNPRWFFYWWLHHSSCEYLLAKIIFPPAKIICPPAKISFPPAKIIYQPAKIIFPPAKIIFPPAKIFFPPAKIIFHLPKQFFHLPK